MTFCPNCGSDVRSDAAFCPSCGATFEQRSRQLPPLDLEHPENRSPQTRMESFPPLFDEPDEQERRTKPVQQTGAAGNGENGTHPPAAQHGSKGKNFILITFIVIVIAAAAAAAVYILLPVLKSADGEPVFYLSDGALYMLRGSRAENTCLVYDLSGQLPGAEEQYGGAQEAAKALMQTFFYDRENETLYFLDFRNSLYSVRINKLGLGKRDIQDRVEQIATDIYTSDGADTGLLETGYTVIPATGQVFYLQLIDTRRSFYVYTDGDSRLLAEDAEAYRVSASGASALYLQENSAYTSQTEYTLYIRSTGTGDLVKVDSRVSTVERLDDEFDMIWYTRYDPENTEGPVSVWIGGKSIENEQVLAGLWACGGFSESGFYYAVQTTQRLSVWDYIADVSASNASYSSYATLRSVLMNSTFEHKSQTVSFWSESGSRELAQDVAAWEVLNAEHGLLSMEVCDLASMEKLSITRVRSAYSAIEYLENTQTGAMSYFSFGGGAAFEGEGLTYCCISSDGSELWMIDNTGGRGILYSCTVSESGFIDRTRLSSDVYAAAYWSERNSLLYVRDYNSSTLRCDLYILEGGTSACISYDVYLPEWEVALCDDGTALVYLQAPVFSDDTVSAALYYYSDGASTLVAEGVSGCACVSAYRIFYLAGNEGGGAVLFSYDGTQETITGGVSAVTAPGVQKSLKLVQR